MEVPARFTNSNLSNLRTTPMILPEWIPALLVVQNSSIRNSMATAMRKDGGTAMRFGRLRGHEKGFLNTVS